MIKLIFDYFLLIIAIVIFILPIIAISIILLFSPSKKIIHWSKRIGKNSNFFYMPKFVTMSDDTPDLPTHLLIDSNKYITRIGRILRKTSLDELPQLYSVAKRDMSFVGPRPALHNQEDLINSRKKLQVDKLLPGITGWAQINGRDDISIKLKVDLDNYYKKNYSLFFDIKILFLTVINIIQKKNIKH